MKQNKSGKRNVRKAVDVTNDSNLSEDERQGYATIEEIRKGLFGFMPAITQHMHFPCGETDDPKNTLRGNR